MELASMGDSIFPSTKRTRSQLALPASLLQDVSLSRSPLKNARLARRNQIETESSGVANSHGTTMAEAGEEDEEDDELLLSPKRPIQLGNKRSPSPSTIADRPHSKRLKSSNSDSDVHRKTHVRHFSDSKAVHKSSRKRSATPSASRNLNSADPPRHQSPALPTKERARSLPTFPSSASFPTIDFLNPPASPTRSPRSRSRSPERFEINLRATSGPFVLQPRGTDTTDNRTRNPTKPSTVTFSTIVEEPATPKQPYNLMIPMSPLTPLPETPHPTKLLAKTNAVADRYVVSEGWFTTDSNDGATTHGVAETDLERQNADLTTNTSDTTRATTTVTARSRLPRPTHTLIPSATKEDQHAPKNAASSSKSTIPAPPTSRTAASRRAAAQTTSVESRTLNAFDVLMQNSTAKSKTEKGKGKAKETSAVGSSKATLSEGKQMGVKKEKKEKGKNKAAEAQEAKPKASSLKAKMKPKEKTKEKSTPRLVVIESEDEEDGVGGEQRDQSQHVARAERDMESKQTLDMRPRPLSPSAEVIVPPDSNSSLFELNDDPFAADDGILRMDDGVIGFDTAVRATGSSHIGGDERGGMTIGEDMHEAESDQHFLPENEVSAADSPLFSEPQATPSPLFTEGELDQETLESSAIPVDTQNVSTTDDNGAPVNEDVAMQEASLISSGSLQLTVAPVNAEPLTEEIDESQTSSPAVPGKGTRKGRQKRTYPVNAVSRVTRSTAGRKALGRAVVSITPSALPIDTVDSNKKVVMESNATPAPVSSLPPEAASPSFAISEPPALVPPTETNVDADVDMADVTAKVPSHDANLDPMNIPDYNHDANSVSSLSDLPSDMDEEDTADVEAAGVRDMETKRESTSEVQEHPSVNEGHEETMGQELAQVPAEPVSSKARGKAKALIAGAEPRRSPRDRKGEASTATSVTRAVRKNIAGPSIPVTPARAKAALPKVPSVVPAKSQSILSPSKLVRSSSMFTTRRIGNNLEGGVVKGDTKALNVLENALEKLLMPPPARPNTSLGFNRDDDSDTSLELAVKSKDDGSIGQSSLGLGRPSALQRASTVGSLALEASSSGASSSSSTSFKPRALTQKPLSMFMPVGTGPGLNGPSKRPGAIMRGGRAGAGIVKRLPMGPFGSGRGQKASQKTSLPSVMASPVKGGGATADTDINIPIADEDTDALSVGVDLSIPDSDVFGDEGKGPIDLSELQSTSTDDKGKGKASDSEAPRRHFKRASLAAAAFSQSLSALPTETPSAGSMGPPATPPPRREGLRSSSSHYPSSSKTGASQDEGSSKAKPKSNILQDCKVFVDVRSEDGEDVASWFVDALTDLGARIMTRVGPTCTHVVFKDGLLSTITRYRTLNDPKPFVVGVSWIVECLEQRQHADESRFLIDLEDFKFSSSHKRRKSMIPKLIPQTVDGSQNTDGDISMDGSNTSITEDDLPPLARARLRQSMLLSARS